MGFVGGPNRRIKILGRERDTDTERHRQYKSDQKSEDYGMCWQGRHSRGLDNSHIENATLVECVANTRLFPLVEIKQIVVFICLRIAHEVLLIDAFGL